MKSDQELLELAAKAAGLLRKHVKKLPSTQPVPVNPLFTTVWRTL